jgi:glycine/sarcosine N-methyltransferase
VTPGGEQVRPPAGDYDRFVDWGKRIEREMPFFRLLFADHDVRSVIDVGCGTGRHAALFASWGLDVTGVDPDPAMLDQARAFAVHQASSARFVEGGFGGLATLGLPLADALTCTGNALPHVDGLAGLRAAVRDFASVLRPGGVVALHLLNHDRLLATQVRSIQPVVREDEEGTWVFLRVMDYVEGGIRFDFATLHRPVDGWEHDAPWEVSSRRSLHTALPSSVLASELEAAGFGDVHLFGDHTGRALDPSADESVIVTAVKG